MLTGQLAWPALIDVIKFFALRFQRRSQVTINLRYGAIGIRSVVLCNTNIYGIGKGLRVDVLPWDRLISLRCPLQ